MLRMARGQTLAALSREANGRSPIMWQIEFTDQLAWWSSVIRTSPAQKNAVTAPEGTPKVITHPRILIP